MTTGACWTVGACLCRNAHRTKSVTMHMHAVHPAASLRAFWTCPLPCLLFHSLTQVMSHPPPPRPALVAAAAAKARQLPVRLWLPPWMPQDSQTSFSTGLGQGVKTWRLGCYQMLVHAALRPAARACLWLSCWISWWLPDTEHWCSVRAGSCWTSCRCACWGVGTDGIVGSG